MMIMRDGILQSARAAYATQRWFYSKCKCTRLSCLSCLLQALIYIEERWRIIYIYIYKLYFMYADKQYGIGIHINALSLYPKCHYNVVDKFCRDILIYTLKVALAFSQIILITLLFKGHIKKILMQIKAHKAIICVRESMRLMYTNE